MEVKLLKPHDGNASGDVIDVTPERANYLVRCNAAVYTDGVNSPVTQKQVKAKAPAKPKAQKQVKQVKPKLEKK